MKFNLELSDEAHIQIKIMAAKKKKSMNQLIEMAIDKLIESEKKESLV
jgi:predicted HicB family RNase H-like nuclease